MDFLGILEVAIGIVLVYLVLSLVCTAAMEALDGNLLRIRPGVLNDLVERLVGYSIARQVFDSEEVRVLAKSSDTKPSYIPTEVFAHSILEIAAGEDWRKLANTPTVLREKLVAYGEVTEEQAQKNSGQEDSEEDVEENAEETTREDVEEVAENKAEEKSAIEKERERERQKLSKTLVKLLDEAGGDIELFINKIELWFDRTGDRAKGWYKRRVNGWLIVIGFVIAALVNADTISIFQRLTEDPALRKAAVELAEQRVAAQDKKKDPTPPADVVEKKDVPDGTAGANTDGAESNGDVEVAPGAEGSEEVGASEGTGTAEAAPEPEAEAAAGANDSETGSKKSPGGSEAKATDGEPSSLSDIKKEFGDIEPMVGWSDQDAVVQAWQERSKGSAERFEFLKQAVIKFAGLAMTAIAVSLGAPFWFDLLQKLMNVRKSVVAAKPADLSKAAGKDGGDSKAAGTKQKGESDDEKDSDKKATVPVGPMQGFSPTTADASLDNVFWLSKAADLAYLKGKDGEKELKSTVESWGMEIHSFKASVEKEVFEALGVDVDIVDTQGFVAIDDRAVFVCFRGTEPTEPGDIVTDAQFELVKAGSYASDKTDAKVHKGFQLAVDAAWGELDRILHHQRIKTQPVWFSGHSLGGALAVLAASRHDLDVTKHNSKIRADVEAEEKKPGASLDDDATVGKRQKAAKGLRGRVAGVYTIGQPRVGDETFCEDIRKRLGDRHVRVINNRDIVPRVPLRAMSYDHSGKVLYFDEFGRLHRDPGLWYRFLDTVFVSRADMATAKEAVTDHSSKGYVDLLDKARKDSK